MQWLTSAWFWAALAVALFALEAAAPGAFMLWFGCAAVVTTLVVAVLPLSLSAQWLLFSALAVVAVLVGYRYRKRNPPTSSDQPLLNHRTSRFVGTVQTLEQPIVNGRGRIKVGDTFWTVHGDDAPAGTPVRVLGADGMTLLVTTADPAHLPLSR